MMKIFLKRLALFLLIPLPLLYRLQYIVDTGLRQSKHPYYQEWNDIFNSRINADLLICGSSRAVNDISPAVLDTALHTNSYNIGMDGSHTRTQFDRLQIYLQHNKAPQLLVQVVDLTSFVDAPKLDNPLHYLPYLNDSAVRRLTRKYTDHYSFAEYYLPMVRYANQLPIVIEGIKSYFGKGMAPRHYKGYCGISTQWDGSFKHYIIRIKKPVNIHITSVSVNALEQQLAHCRQHNIRMVLVFPPVYYSFIRYTKNTTSILQIFRNMAARYNVPFLDYSESPISFNKGNFYNSQHLNKRGAELFSAQLATDLSSIGYSTTGQ